MPLHLAWQHNPAYAPRAVPPAPRYLCTVALEGRPVATLPVYWQGGGDRPAVYTAEVLGWRLERQNLAALQTAVETLLRTLLWRGRLPAYWLILGPDEEVVPVYALAGPTRPARRGGAGLHDARPCDPDPQSAALPGGRRVRPAGPDRPHRPADAAGRGPLRPPG